MVLSCPVIIPGILVQTVIVASIVTGTQLREDMNKGVFDRFRSLPIARISPLAGALLAVPLLAVLTAAVRSLVAPHEVAPEQVDPLVPRDGRPPAPG